MGLKGFCAGDLKNEPTERMFIATDFSSTRRALWIILEKEKDGKEDEDKYDKKGKRKGGWGWGEEEKGKPPCSYLCIEVLKPGQLGAAFR